MMKKKKISDMSDATKTSILERWRHSKANSLKAIAAEFSCSANQVNTIINKYLATKILP
jgi:predicted transcriptional regulator